ncbi:GNAT family N-acetyltransferase [Flagellimonas sp.]|uniref:GNAT family N-acetyltransferase n=1 Tax=Flagellimonas sp. TaxID=2058762 RepID=UPI003B5041F3
MIKIIEHKGEWDKWVSSMDHFDFYHTYDYHQLLCNIDEKVLLIAYEQGTTQIGLPVIERTLENGYKDLTSVHGYLGPVHKNLDHDFENKDFSKALKNLLESKKIIAIFSKLNPYVPMQNAILKNMGRIENVGELVYFDQTSNEEEQRTAYSRNTRQVLKKLRKNSYIRVGDLKKDLKAFIKYYHRSLDRLKAKSLFYFDENYFTTLFNSNFFTTDILFAVNCETNEIMAGALLIETKEIAHVELAFTVEKYFKSSPLRLLFDECRKRYKKNDVKFLNLGGGTGGREGSLMRFKSSFSKNYAAFKVWKFVVMPKAYENMLTEEQKNTESNFFPKYRLKTA